MEKIGLVPAAGYARRLGAIGKSKEMLRINGDYGDEPVCNGLFRQFEAAGIKNIVLVTRPEKTDLIHHIEKELDLDIRIIIVLVDKTNSTLESICAAYAHIAGKEVVLGFPDMLIAPADAMQQLSQSMDNSTANIVLGAFPASDSAKCDMVAFDDDQKLKDIKIKDKYCTYEFTWIMASWDPVFSEFLYSSYRATMQESIGREIYIGDLIQLSLKQGQQVDICSVSAGKFIDIGTCEDLDRACQ